MLRFSFLTCPRPRPEGLPCNWKWPACAILIKIHNLENCILRKILITYTFICVCFYISYLPVNLNLSTNALCTLLFCFTILQESPIRKLFCLFFCNASSLQVLTAHGESTRSACSRRLFYLFCSVFTLTNPYRPSSRICPFFFSLLSIENKWRIGLKRDLKFAPSSQPAECSSLRFRFTRNRACLHAIVADVIGIFCIVSVWSILSDIWLYQAEAVDSCRLLTMT